VELVEVADDSEGRTHVLADSLQKQEEGRDWRGRFLKRQFGNPQGAFRKAIAAD
jgi:hypothetical protein